jgi:hypothetical protein
LISLQVLQFFFIFVFLSCLDGKHFCTFVGCPKASTAAFRILNLPLKYVKAWLKSFGARVDLRQACLLLRSTHFCSLCTALPTHKGLRSLHLQLDGRYYTDATYKERLHKGKGEDAPRMTGQLEALASAVEQLEDMKVLGLHDIRLHPDDLKMIPCVLDACPRTLQGLVLSFARDSHPSAAKYSESDVQCIFESISQLSMLEALVLPQLDWFAAKHFHSIAKLQVISGLTVSAPAAVDKKQFLNLANMRFQVKSMVRPFEQEVAVE